MTTDDTQDKILNDKILDSTVRQFYDDLWREGGPYTVAQLLEMADYKEKAAEMLKQTARWARGEAWWIRNEVKKFQRRQEREARRSSANVVELRPTPS